MRVKFAHLLLLSITLLPIFASKVTFVSFVGLVQHAIMKPQLLTSLNNFEPAISIGIFTSIICIGDISRVHFTRAALITAYVVYCQIFDAALIICNLLRIAMLHKYIRPACLLCIWFILLLNSNVQLIS